MTPVELGMESYPCARVCHYVPVMLELVGLPTDRGVIIKTVELEPHDVHHCLT